MQKISYVVFKKHQGPISFGFRISEPNKKWLNQIFYLLLFMSD